MENDTALGRSPVGPATPLTLRPGDNGSTTLLSTGTWLLPGVGAATTGALAVVLLRRRTG